jgi:hypothetical protein
MAKKLNKDHVAAIQSVHNISGFSIFLIFTLVLILWGGCYYYLAWRFPEITPITTGTTSVEAAQENAWPSRGQFGDMFGAVNALFSGLAFATIVITLWQQRIDLRLQKVALAASQADIQIQNATLEEQNVTLKRQRFESTFFNMLSIHFEILKATKMMQSEGVHTFSHLVNSFQNSVVRTTIPHGEEETVPKIENALKYNPDHHFVFEQAYAGSYSYFMENVSQYLQSLVNMYDAIKQSRFPKNVERRYTRLLSGYISLAERKFLYYHIILSPTGGINENIREFDDDLNLLNSMSEADLIRTSHINMRQYYKKLRSKQK